MAFINGIEVGKKLKDISGESFGSWTVVSFAGRVKNCSMWNCRCDCGTEAVVNGNSMIRGISKSCGCQKRVYSTHGYTRGFTRGKKHPAEYTAWVAMKGRCYNPSNNRYHLYGARGICVCERWRGKNGFSNFLSDMGPRPSENHSIDRKDNDGNYEPGNCRWATDAEQASNQRRNMIVDWNGERLTVAEVARRTGIKAATLYQRIHMGLTIERAVSEPVQGPGKKTALAAMGAA